MERYFEDLLAGLGLAGAERENWYRARHYVLNCMTPPDGEGISPTSRKRVHMVVEEADDALMQAVVRQLCLVVHYPNFCEQTGENRTRITLCSPNPRETCGQMRRDRVLGNLTDYCRCNLTDGPEATEGQLPLDIELEFVSGKDCTHEEGVTRITPADVREATRDFDAEHATMDTTMGRLVNMVYNTGAEIDNLPAIDNANIRRYSVALNMFCYKIKTDMIGRKWDECADVRAKLSSVFCADCFEARIKGLLDTRRRPLADYLLHDFRTVMRVISHEETLGALKRCEHARWNVERLIMGCRPLRERDWYELENRFGDERAKEIRRLKREGRHIDLCSERDLRRVDPANIKYDYFLMLAMPQIMRGYLLAGKQG